MKPWEKDKGWSDQFLPEIKGILGQTFIGAAPPEEDMEHNTDLIVLRMEPLRIACRIRRAEYFSKYRDEFTIRTARPNGVKTELYKLIEDWGNYFFYGFGGDDGLLIGWGIGDLRTFRGWFNGYIVKNQGKLPGTEKSNKDGSSDFRAFRWRELPSQFVVAQYGLARQPQRASELPEEHPVHCPIEPTMALDGKNQRTLF